jgi:hypothetical protein
MFVRVAAVADIDRLGVEAWLARLGANGAGATTLLRAHGVLSGILAAAVKAKRLSANPANTGRLCWCWPTADFGGAKRSLYVCAMSRFCGDGSRYRRTRYSSA